MSEQDPGALSPESIAAIKRVNEVFSGYVVAQDWDSLLALYTSDVVMMPANQPAIHGNDNLRAWFEAFPKVTAMEIGVHRVEGRGDLAYVLGWYTMTLHPEGAPGPIEDKGKFVEIRKKQPDGTWPVAADMFSSDLEH